MTETFPPWVELPAARPLFPSERDLLAALVGFADCGPLTQQLDTVRVMATCGCGCSSVRLATGGPAVPPELVLGFSEIGRDDWFTITATAGVLGGKVMISG